MTKEKRKFKIEIQIFKGFAKADVDEVDSKPEVKENKETAVFYVKITTGKEIKVDIKTLSMPDKNQETIRKVLMDIVDIIVGIVN